MFGNPFGAVCFQVWNSPEVSLLLVYESQDVYWHVFGAIWVWSQVEHRQSREACLQEISRGELLMLIIPKNDSRLGDFRDHFKDTLCAIACFLACNCIYVVLIYAFWSLVGGHLKLGWGPSWRGGGGGRAIDMIYFFGRFFIPGRWKGNDNVFFCLGDFRTQPRATIHHLPDFVRFSSCNVRRDDFYVN